MMQFLSPHFAKHKAAVAVGGVAVVLALTALLFGDGGLLAYRALEKQHRSLEEYAFELQENNAELRRRVELLRSDTRHLEELARERLGLVRPNEIVYVVDDDLAAFR